MSSLKDVAKLAGVSPSTVSYFLNGKKSVRQDTEQRIMDAVKELNYRPNLVARSLKMKVSKSIGILVSDLSNVFFLDILSGIESVLAKSGYTSIVSNSMDSSVIERKNLLELRNRNIDGVILLGTGENDPPATDEYGIPIVSVDRIGDREKYTISVDNLMGGYIGMSYLLKKQRRKVAFIGFKQRISLADRFEGCRRACLECGLDPDDHLIYVETEISPEGGYDAVMNLFGEGKLQQCDAVFAAADYAAFGALKAINNLGIRVPDELAVMGFDDLILSRFTQPALTTVQLPRTQMGERAARMLLDLVEGKPCEDRILFRPTLIIRDSA